MAGYLNRHRASILMREQGLSALVLAQPESITYASGTFAGVASFWRRAGAAFLLVPADPASPLAAIVGDLQAKSFAVQSHITDIRSHPIWVEADSFPLANVSKPKRTPRPAQYDLRQSLQLLQDLLNERGYSGSRVGLELGFIPASDYPAFLDLPVHWADCTRIVERLRTVKHPDEILKLRRAAEFAGAGLEALKKRIVPGMTSAEMVAIWSEGAAACARLRQLPQPQSSWAYISVGGDGFEPGGPAASGDIIKVDVGCVVDGYSSDGARTLAIGKPTADASKVFDALHRAFEVGLALLKPGTPLKDIYFATASSMWNDGFEGYGRGHFGHGVGASIWSEEWPFISADASAVLEPGMVMAFETPWYIDGLGGFIIEDQVLITETGSEIMAPSSREMTYL
jgi:Xaa-Pro aminopeptidase